MKSNIALEDMVILIVAVMLLGILIFIFFEFSSFTYAPIVVVDNISSMTRNLVITNLLYLVTIFIGIFMLFIWTSRMCYGFPVGTAACAAISASVTIAITAYVLSMASAIPFLFIGPITLSAAPSDLNTSLVSYAVDSAAMINYGRGEPLYGYSEDPIQCFIIKLNPGTYDFTNLFSDLNGLRSGVPMESQTKVMTQFSNPHDYDTFKIGKKTFAVYFYNDYVSISLLTKNGPISCNGFYVNGNFVLKKVGSCGGALNSEHNYRVLFQKENNKYWQVTLGKFTLNYEVLPNKEIHFVYQTSKGWETKNVDIHNLNDLPKLVVPKKGAVLYIEFFDDYNILFNGPRFYSPECGNKNMGEGVYVCVPYEGGMSWK